ncbi:hypothetical protein [Acinetobacter sp. SFA]|uniref:hypothetical protein n=1 Tax=Acinetobacter sp. SFA TaxID=1805633 RepID=UPI0007D08E68|nr:hypothetical protein [Acinetobacter sp. SFA]OAL80488.1 hypothetical protein AY607_02010 [Acinetobacter sp. SFA]
MVASTDIKFYVHTNNNAPQLQNAYGSMINVLDACLIDGIQIGVVSSLTASGNTVTATFGAAHNLMQYQVIKITGANQPEFNGEHRILSIPDTSSFTFELAAVPSVTTATGTISASLPPLGWERPFSSVNANGGGKAAYRSLNLLLPSRPFLRVVDELDPAYTATYAKYAKVGIVEDMTDIDTMLGVQAPFDAVNPDKNWVGTGSGTAVINGWSRWYYARNGDASLDVKDNVSPPNGIRQYILIGSTDCFYLINSTGYQMDNCQVYGFGAYESLIDGYAFNNFLSTSLFDRTVNDYNRVGENTSIGLNGGAENILTERMLSRLDKFGQAKAVSSLFNTNRPSGSSNAHAYIPVDKPIFPIYLSGEGMYGRLKYGYHLVEMIPYSHKQLIVKDNKAYIAINIAAYVAPRFGQMVFEIGDTQ